MADTMQFDLVSPERRLASIVASTVQIPGADGDMTAMPDHAPTVTTLRPGLVTVSGPEGTSEYLVTGGFVEIVAGSATLLAEQAFARADVTQDLFAGLMTEMRAMQSAATPEGADHAAKLVADLAAVGAEMGLSAA